MANHDTVSFAHLYALRDSYQRQADDFLQKVADVEKTIQTAREATKLATRADAMVGKVREQATGIAPAKRVTGPGFVAQHADLTARPAHEIRRLLALAHEQGLSSLTQGAIFNALQRARRKAGTTSKNGRPVRDMKGARLRRLAKSGDNASGRVRALFAAHPGTVFTRAEVAERARLAEIIPSGVQQGAAKALAALVNRKELKATKDGFIAHKLQLPSNNGAHA